MRSMLGLKFLSPLYRHVFSILNSDLWKKKPPSSKDPVNLIPRKTSVERVISQSQEKRIIGPSLDPTATFNSKLFRTFKIYLSNKGCRKNLDFSIVMTPQVEKRSRACIEAIRQFNKTSCESAGFDITQKHPLVIGEPSRLAAGEVLSVELLNVLRVACEEHSEETVLFHFNSGAFDRNKIQNYLIANGLRNIEIVDSNVTIFPDIVTHVYVLTSILALDYIMHGVRVSVYGKPFYAGYGLTDDRNSDFSQIKKINLSDFFYRLFLISAEYTSPLTQQSCSLEEYILSKYFEHYDFIQYIFKLNLDKLTKEAFAEIFSGQLSEVRLLTEHTDTAKLLLPYLGQSCFGLILKDYFQTFSLTVQNAYYCTSCSNTTTIQQLFLFCLYVNIKNGEYDSLPEILEAYGNWFEIHSNQMSKGEVGIFLSQYYFGFNNLWGREVSRIPSFDCFKGKIDSAAKANINKYFQLLSANFEYSRMISIIDKLTVITNENFFYGLHSITNRVIQAENDGYSRERVCALLKDVTMQVVTAKYSSDDHLLFNNLLRYTFEDDLENVVSALYKVMKYNHSFLILKQRKNLLAHSVRYLIRKKEYATAEALISFLKPVDGDLSTSLAIQIKGEQSDSEGIATLLIKNSHLLSKQTLMMHLVNALHKKGRFQDAYEILLDTLTADIELNLFSFRTKFNLMAYRFLTDIGKEYLTVEQPNEPKAVVFIASSFVYNSCATVALCFPMLMKLKERGYAVSSLSEGILPFQPTGNPEFDECYSLLTLAGDDGKILLDWNIDWENQRVECEGINFYQGFFERIAIDRRAFSIDFQDPYVQLLFKDQLMKADSYLRACLHIHRIARSHNIPVYFIENMPYQSPFSIIRDYCLHYNDLLMKIVLICPGNDFYFKQDNSLLNSTISLVNMSNYPTCRSPKFGVRQKFEEWYDKNINSNEIDEYIQQQQAKANLLDNSFSSPKLKRILEEKQAGKSVICCFGRVLVDIALTYDGGEAHKNIVDWIQHTVETVADREDIILVIKPHPAELNPQIARRLRESFRSLLPQNLPDNVIFLDHFESSTHELSKLIDLGIMWVSSAGYELAILGVPVMVCSSCSRNDYLIDVLSPESRPQYEEFITKGTFPKLTPDVVRRAAASMVYCRSDNVAFPLVCCSIPSNNDWVGLPAFDEEKYAQIMHHQSVDMDKALQMFFD